MTRRVTLTRHAASRLQQPGISLDQCMAVIDEPMEMTADPAADGRIRALGKPEGQDKAIRVDYVETGDERRIVTATFDRNWRKGA